ncbi:MAG: hypothetical protein MN733_31705, partial [Nitrososphaera sp.]|nr:hypothetical protein [Nitrososphaera sp.]
LVSPVANEPNVEIDYDPALELAQLYGYEPRLRQCGVRLKLDNMNQGLTQVVLMRFRLVRKMPDDSRLPVKVRFTYYDLEQKKQVVKTQESFITVKDRLPGDLLKDTEVGKNYSIALLAQAIRDMAAAYEARHFHEAERLLTTAIAETCERYPNLEDRDIRRTLSIAEKYRDALKKYNRLRDSGIDR